MSADLEFRRDLPEIVRRPAIKLQIPRPGSDQDGCQTPTSEENKIPAVVQCPAAPRKRKRNPSCKRRLMTELEFFEILNPDEIEPYFSSSFQTLKSAKRSFCHCKS